MEPQKVYIVVGEYSNSGGEMILGVLSSPEGAERRINSLKLQFPGLYEDFEVRIWVVEEE